MKTNTTASSTTVGFCRTPADGLFDLGRRANNKIHEIGSAVAEMSRSLTSEAEAEAQLQEGINLLLSRWAALRMGVKNEWGGRDSLQKSQQLGQDLFHLLTQSKEQVYIDDVEDMLDEFMLSLHTVIGDGSIEEPSSNDEEDSEDSDVDGDDTLREGKSSEMEVDDAPHCQSSRNEVS